MVSAVDTFDRRLSSKACAVHEAGHLFASLIFAPTVRVQAVWIQRTPGGQWEGRVDRQRSRTEWEADRREDRHAETLVSLAGPIAETRWRLRGRWNAILAGSANAKIAVGMRHEAGGDFGTAIDHLEWLGVDDLHKGFCEAWQEAEELLHKHWPSIVRVGSLLKDRGRIGAAELGELPDVKAVLRAV